ncbi:ribonuclease III [Dehalogenimonas sp. THU2]|uniref:ribonuclease III n=1 Tax=Dehalogenimonas sp. THU2 TaxID=3151121 RepID=UPI003218BCF2
MAELKKLQSVINVTFHNLGLLELALIHSSYVNERPGSKIDSNERLEFLGDAVLGQWVAGKLYRLLPEAAEGVLTQYRSILVRRGTMARLAETIDLGAYLYLGRGEEASGGRRKPANLSRALEALIAAVYLDQGQQVAGEFLNRLYADDLEKLELLSAGVDYKSKLQELIQGTCHTTPEYSIVESAGAAHQPLFTAEVRAGGVLLGSGQGYSKKEAESQSARLALQNLQDTLHPDDALLTLDQKEKRG